MNFGNILWDAFKQTPIGNTIDTIGRLCTQPEKELKRTASQILLNIPNSISVDTRFKSVPIRANVDMSGIKSEVERYTKVTPKKQVVYFEANGVITQEEANKMNESLRRSDYL
jgi:hypothetical protein